MAPGHRKRGEPCSSEGCGSRRFHIGDDGYTYCDQGHQQRERGAVIAEDTGEFVALGRKVRKKDSDAESTVSKASGFSGADALEHYLLCLQLVLRKQLRWLIEVQQLPEELEGLVKDLWALRLQKLQGKTTYESETDTERPSSQEFFSSQSESEGRSASQASRRSRRQGRARGAPNLLELLSLCYTGTLLLRSPVTGSDLLGWVDVGVLLYYRAVREVPADLKHRLPAQYQALLEPQDLLKPESFHEGIFETLSSFHHDFGMAVPSINTPLVVFRWMKKLALPLEVFAGTQRLASLLELDIKFDLAKTGVRTRMLLRYPEVQLMTLLLVTTKLLFPLEPRAYRTRAATDLSAVVFDWDAWVALHNSSKDGDVSSRKLVYAEAFAFDEGDCLTSSGDKLDAYLDWCEDNIASEDIREHGAAGKDAPFRRALFEMFPNTGRHKQKSSEAPKTSSSSHTGKLVGRPRLTDETAPGSIPTVGDFYRRFRSAEDLSGPAKLLFETGARLACVSVEGMVQSVFVVERRLQKIEDRLRKGQAE